MKDLFTKNIHFRVAKTQLGDIIYNGMSSLWRS